MEVATLVGSGKIPWCRGTTWRHKDGLPLRDRSGNVRWCPCRGWRTGTGPLSRASRVHERYLKVKEKPFGDEKSYRSTFSGDHRGRSSGAFESNKLGTTYMPNRERPTIELPSFCFTAGKSVCLNKSKPFNSEVRESVTAQLHSMPVTLRLWQRNPCSLFLLFRSFVWRPCLFHSPPLGSACNNFCCVYYSRANGNLKEKKTF